MSSRAISGALNEATLLVTKSAIFLPASSLPLVPVMSLEGWLETSVPCYFFSRPVSYAESKSWIISLRVYFPALAGIRRSMSGSAGSIGRTKPGILSYIACTPAMISSASFSPILFPFSFVFALFVLILFTSRLALEPTIHRYNEFPHT